MPVKPPSQQEGSVQLHLQETHILKAILEFLQTRGLHIAQLSLERETGVINGEFSDDVIFLRQLILDGQWDNALDFVEPLKSVEDFDFRTFRYNITKYKFFELLCVKLEPGPLYDNDFAVEELVECLKDLEHICPSPEDYRQLCALLTLPKLSDHSDFHNWNPSSARVECFLKIQHLVVPLLPPTGKEKETDITQASNDRLVSLLTKGVFYEGCVDYCQAQAIGDTKGLENGPHPSTLLSQRPRLSATDLSLVSWLEMVSPEQFAMPFQQKQLDLKLDHLKKPKLEAQWTETILATPLKPSGKFPHSMVPNGKLKFAEKMSQSMTMLPMTMSMTTSAFPAIQKGHPMSQSTAPGFCLGIGDASTDAMVQSQIIDNMMEQSQLTKSSRPDNLRTMPPVMTGSLAPQVMAPAMAQSMMGGAYDFTPIRRQLDEMTRRSLPPPSSQRQSSLPPVPELGTPPHAEDIDIMTQSRLFQQFNNKQRMTPPSVQYRGGGMPQQSAVSMASGMMPMMQTPQPQMGNMQQQQQQQQFQQPAMYDQQMMYTNGHTIPQSISPNPNARPQSMMMPPGHQAAPGQHGVPMANGVIGGPPTRPVSMPPNGATGMSVQFVPVCRYEDSQAIRTVAFHPSGKYFAVGTNSKQMHICRYPDMRSVRPHEAPRHPEVLVSRPKQHRGSVYCMGFNPTGDLLATGSNDKTLRLMGFNSEQCKIGAEMELNCHDGTVRDIIFLEDTVNRSSIVVSGGAGTCNLYATDCNTGQTMLALKGHSAPILGLYAPGGGPTFVSCSQDKTIRFWDIRSPQAINVIQPSTHKSHSSPVTSVCVDPSGQLLVSGHEDATVALFDICGNRVIQSFRPHGDEVRTVRFSNAAFYLLSASYDKRVVITDMRGDLMAPLMYLPVAEHTDKVIQCRWHPFDFSFLSTSADRSAVLWALPPNQRYQ